MPVTSASKPRFAKGERVIVNHPRVGRHYGTMLGPDESNEDACHVRVDGNFVYPEWTVLEEWLQKPLAARDAVIGDLLDLQLLKGALERPFEGKLWVAGDSGTLTPHVCKCSFGDGLKLLGIATINQRPNYHIVRVHSAWDISNYSTGDNVGEHIDDILTAIEDESGGVGKLLDEPCDSCGDTCCTCDPNYDRASDWPAIDADSGCSWFEIPWSDLRKKAGW